MKIQFIESLTKILIYKHGYKLWDAVSGSSEAEDRQKILSLKRGRTEIFVEIIDGDSLTSFELEEKMQKDIDKVGRMESLDSFYNFKIFISNLPPEDYKFEKMLKYQFLSSSGKVHANSIVVDLSTGTVKALFDNQVKDFGLTSEIDMLFQKGIDEKLRNISVGDLTQDKRGAAAEKRAVGKKPVITYTLLGINIFIWLLINIIDSASKLTLNELFDLLGSKDNLKIIQGEYWRLLTPVFLHGSILHLMFNSYALFILGSLVEKIMGRNKFILIYFVSAIIGSIASFMFSANPGIGASGAIFGLFGTILFLGVIRPALFKSHFGRNIITIILINLFLGFANEMIDNAAHIGGLVGGFMITGILLGLREGEWYKRKMLYILLIITLSSTGLFYGFNSPQNKALTLLDEMTKYEEENDWTNVEINAEEIIDAGYGNKEVKRKVLISLVIAEGTMRKYSEAIEHAEELLKYDKINGHYLLGQIYYNKGDFENARKELIKALEYGATDANIQKILDEINK